MASPPRKFSDLRPSAAIVRPTSQTEPPELILRRAFVGSSDGVQALAILRNMVATPCLPGAPNRALREAEGARNFVAKIEKLIQGQDVPRSEP